MRKFSIFDLIKAGLLVFLAVFWIFQLKPQGIYSKASMDTVTQALLSKTDSQVYPQQASNRLMRYFNLDPSTFDAVGFYRTDDAMSAGELLVVQYSTPEQKEKFEEAAKTRKDSQKQIYEGYAPEQAGTMAAAVIDAQNNFGLYYAGPDPEGMMAAFENVLKEGK